MTAFYSEWDPYCAQWLRNLIKEGLIPDGIVDERDIRLLQPADLEGFVQVHLFGGLGGWAYAARLAGWPDDRPLWTGSCPCQPFSVAGKRAGFADDRHLWPVWRDLIAVCRPPIIVGEQVASAGKAAAPHLQRLRDREGVVRVLQAQNVFGSLPHELQNMLSGGICNEPSSPRSERTHHQEPHSVPAQTSGEGVMQFGASSRETERDNLRSRPSFGAPSGHHNERQMPTNRDAVQSGWGEDLGQPVSGQDRQHSGLYERQCPNSSVLRQRHGESVGRGQNPRNSERDRESADDALRQASDCSTEGSPQETNWLALVHGDLEALGYAVGAIPVEAASVGAPHRRDRFWFVATNAHRQGQYDGALHAEMAGAPKPLAHPLGPRLEGRALLARDHAGELAALERGGPLLADPSRDPWESRRASNAGEGQGGRYADRSPFGADVPHADQQPLGRPPVARPERHNWELEPDVGRVAHGVPARVDRLRALGNAIVPQVGAEILASIMEMDG